MLKTSALDAVNERVNSGTSALELLYRGQITLSTLSYDKNTHSRYFTLSMNDKKDKAASEPSIAAVVL